MLLTLPVGVIVMADHCISFIMIMIHLTESCGTGINIQLTCISALQMIRMKDLTSPIDLTLKKNIIKLVVKSTSTGLG